MANKTPKNVSKKTKKKNAPYQPGFSEQDYNRCVDNLIKNIVSPPKSPVDKSIIPSYNTYGGYDDFNDDYDDYDDYDDEYSFDCKIDIDDIEKCLGMRIHDCRIIFTVPLCIFGCDSDLRFIFPEGLLDSDDDAIEVCRGVADGELGTAVYHITTMTTGEYLAMDIYPGFLVYCDIPEGASLILCTVTGIPVAGFTRQNGKIMLIKESE